MMGANPCAHYTEARTLTSLSKLDKVDHHLNERITSSQFLSD